MSSDEALIVLVLTAAACTSLLALIFSEAVTFDVIVASPWTWNCDAAAIVFTDTRPDPPSNTNWFNDADDRKYKSWWILLLKLMYETRENCSNSNEVSCCELKRFKWGLLFPIYLEPV